MNYAVTLIEGVVRTRTAENSGGTATVLAVPSSAEPAEAQDFRQKLGLPR